MARIIDIYQPGSLLSQGLGSGLQQLAQQRVNELQRRQQIQQASSGLQTLHELQQKQISPQQAQALAQLDPRLLGSYLRGLAPSKSPLVNIGVGGKSYADYIKNAVQESSTSKDALQFVNRLKELNKEGKINAAWWGKTPEAREFESEIAALESFAKTNPRVKKLSQRLKHNLAPEEIDRELYAIEKEFHRKNYRDQAIKDVLRNTGGNIPSDFEDAIENRIRELEGQSLQGPKAETAQEDQLAENPQSNSILDMITDMPRAAAGVATRGLQGLGEGVAGLATSPFTLANIASLGNIPVPESAQSIQNAPENIIKATTGNLTEPRSEVERYLGDIAQTAGSLLSPGAFLGKIGKAADLLGKGSKWIDAAAKILNVTPKTAAATAGVGETAKWLTKEVGGGEGAQQAAKMGGMLLVPMIGARTAGLKVNALNNELEQAALNAPKISSRGLFDELSPFFNSLNKGAPSATKDALKAQIEPLSSIQFPVSDLLKLEKSLESAAKSSAISKTSQHYLPRVLEEINKTMQKASPEVANLYNETKDLGNAINQSSKLQDFFMKYFARRTYSPWLQTVLGVAGLTKPKIFIPAAAGLGSAGEVERVSRMVLTSPAFRKYYGAYVSAALQGNVNEAEKALDNTDKVVKKELGRL